MCFFSGTFFSRLWARIFPSSIFCPSWTFFHHFSSITHTHTHMHNIHKCSDLSLSLRKVGSKTEGLVCIHRLHHKNILILSKRKEKGRGRASRKYKKFVSIVAFWLHTRLEFGNNLSLTGVPLSLLIHYLYSDWVTANEWYDDMMPAYIQHTKPLAGSPIHPASNKLLLVFQEGAQTPPLVLTKVSISLVFVKSAKPRKAD